MKPKRLTKKIELPFDSTYTPKCESIGLGSVVTLTQMLAYDGVCAKLGPLEDIEEKHEIGLLTLANALENGIWFINENGTISGPHQPLISKRGPVLSLDYEFQYELSFGDYGKKEPMGWALTKEELR